MKLIVLGAPGAGKGTQADFLAGRFSVPHISTGDILRGHMAQGTSIGLDISEYMKNGVLVCDDIAIDVLTRRVAMSDCANGFVLDGFPRTLLQAEVLPDIIGVVDCVIYVNVPDDVIVSRMGGRRICAACGAGFHSIFKPSAVDGVCDVCGGQLVRRSDDDPSIVLRRLSVFHQNTKPVLEFYRNSGLLVEVDGVGDVNDIALCIVKLLEEYFYGNND